jgi:glycosyltransferase involved in cell wall biosynthesis
LHFRGALLRALQNAGFEVTAMAPIDGSADNLRRRQVQVCPVPVVRSGTNPIADACLLLRYTRLLRRLRPLAYCSFTIKANIYGGLASRMCGVPLIANVTGLGTTFLSRGLLWQLARRMYQIAFRQAHRVFFHNSDDLKVFLESGIVSASQARLIPGSGVDLERFTPAPFPANAETHKIFLYVGRLIRDKGVREFVDAARALRGRFPTARFQLLGDLDPHNRTSISPAELRSWVEEGAIEHKAACDDVRPAIGAATAVVMPSYREGMSRVLLEAAAMARPLVGTDVPGVRELVEEGVTGALSRARDAESLAMALERIATMPLQRLVELGANARERAERGYGEELISALYLTAIEEIQARRPAS